MAQAKIQPAQSEIVITKPETVALEMSRSEAEVVMALLAYTRDTDPKMPEVYSVFSSLRAVGVEYFDRYEVTEDDDSDEDGLVIRVVRK